MADDDNPPASSHGAAGHGLDELLNGVVAPDSDVKHRVMSAHSQVRDAGVALREAVAKLHRTQAEAWQRYGAEVDRAMADMDADLSSAETQLRIDQAQTRDQLSMALQQVADAWRSRADELRLQTHLGQMEARDAGLHVAADLDRVGHDVLAMIDDLRQDAADSMSTLRERTRVVVDDVMAAMRGVALALRESGDDPDAAKDTEGVD